MLFIFLTNNELCYFVRKKLTKLIYKYLITIILLLCWLICKLIPLSEHQESTATRYFTT